MRHIPEDELHAYLDQALSRGQCVEIETHLAACPACAAERDAIAALRDRTTLLLTTLAPPRRIPPSFAELAAQAAGRRAQRRERLRVALWAASLVGALGIGYAWRGSESAGPGPQPAARDGGAGDARIAASPAPAAATGTISRPVAPVPVTPVTAPSRTTPHRGGASLALVPPAPVMARTAMSEFGSDTLPLEPQPVAEGVWRTVTWDNAQRETGVTPPRLDGLPVVQVQVQPSRGNSGPLMVVAQQLHSGEVIRTIEGPVADVSKLFTRRGTSPVETAEDTVAVAALPEHDRLLAIQGQLPPDSLRALMRRMRLGRRLH